MTLLLTQSTTAVDDNTCQLCAMKELSFTPVQIFCSYCTKSIKRNANYYCRKGEEFDPECCFCSNCYRNKFKDACITFNGTSVSKTLLEQKTNNEVLEEPVSFNTLYYIIQLDIDNFKLTLYDCCFF